MSAKSTYQPSYAVTPEILNLFDWLAATDAHPLIVGSIFHYEFEFIHPFADGNGRMGRLWQSLVLARWNPLFADIPVESLIFEHQAEYYQALQESTRQTDSAPFIAFMLRMILDTVTTSAHQVSPQTKGILDSGQVVYLAGYFVALLETSRWLPMKSVAYFEGGSANADERPGQGGVRGLR